MFEAIILIMGIYVGIPAGAMLVYVAIERHFSRQIRRDAMRCSICGTNNTAALSMVNDTIICANCHQARLFA